MAFATRNQRVTKANPSSAIRRRTTTSGTKRGSNMGAEPAIGLMNAGVSLGTGGCGVGTAPIMGGRGGGKGAVTLAVRVGG